VGRPNGRKKRGTQFVSRVEKNCPLPGRGLCYASVEAKEPVMAHPSLFLPITSLESKLLELRHRLDLMMRDFVKLMLIIMAVALSSCRSVVDTKVQEDGSGELRTSVVFSAEEKQDFDRAPGNSGKKICDNLKANSPPQTEFVEEAQGDETYCTTVHSFNTLQQLHDLYEGMANVTVNDLRLFLGNFVFNIQVDLTSQDGNEAAPSEWRLTLPGEIGENNADAIEGTTLVWSIEPGEVRTLEAESAVETGLLAQIVVGGLIVLVGIILAVWLARYFAKRTNVVTTLFR
jgi:hypothetical protein